MAGRSVFFPKMKNQSPSQHGLSDYERSVFRFEERMREQQRLIDEGKLSAEEATRRNFGLARHIHCKITVRQDILS